MTPFIKHTGVAAPLDRVNVDTDMIIPKQFLRKIERTGFGKNLFHESRFLDYEGTKENPEFILNKVPYRRATILLARDNFGCGSSREHAPWALADFGFRVVIAPSFADIFANNCVQNGILCAVLKTSEVEELFQYAYANSGVSITADLEKQFVYANGKQYPFSINSFSKTCLLNGLDQIGWTLQYQAKIDAFESTLSKDKPWLA